MVWLIDDLAEAALGPWGLAVALGVGVVAATRRAERGVAVADGEVIDAVPISAVSTEPASTRRVAAVPAMVAAAAGRLRGQVQRAVAGTGDYWRDLYAEAHYEWDAARTGSTSPRMESPTPTVAGLSEEPATVAGRVRGPNGRYVKDKA